MLLKLQFHRCISVSILSLSNDKRQNIGDQVPPCNLIAVVNGNNETNFRRVLAIRHCYLELRMFNHGGSIHVEPRIDAFNDVNVVRSPISVDNQGDEAVARYAPTRRISRKNLIAIHNFH